MKTYSTFKLLLLATLLGASLLPALASAVNLTVTKTGTGTVASSPAGINCGTTCVFNYAVNTAVRLTATPAAGWRFVNWTGGCTGTASPCTATMNVAKTVTANFVRIFALTVTKTGTGTVTSNPTGISCGATCAANFNINTNVVLTAAPGAGFRFSSWTNGCTGTATTCTVAMTAAKTVTETFTAIPVALTVTKAGTGSGTVTSNPAGISCGATCAANFNMNSTVTMTAAPAAGSTFTGWSNGCTGTATTCAVSMTAAKTVTATFTAIPVALTVTKAGTGAGTVTSSPAGISCGTTCVANFNQNSSVTLTAAASAGSTFNGWSGGCTGTAATCAVTMNVAKTVTATFAPIPLALTVSKTGTGIGTVTSTPAGINCGATCSASFNQNSSVTLTAAASAGSTFSGWSGGCTGTATTCTVNMTQAQTVSANFALLQKTLTLSKTGTGTGTVVSSPAGIDCGAACTADFNPNQTVKLTATATTGSTFNGWSGACTGSAGTCIVTMTQAQAVTADFLPQTTSINGTTYQYDANGNLTQVTDPLGQKRQIQYDHVDQPVRRLEPDPDVIGATAGQIDTAYDGLGQITQIIDPRNLTTDYQVDHLGNVLSQTSPDSGVTQNTYDDAGNLLTRTDARGKIAAYRYDSQNRLTQAVYEDQTFTYTWDICTNGIGRLCSLANGTHTLALSYDLHGRVTGKAQTEGAVTLNINNSYTASGQIQQTVLPSGHTIGYIWQQDRLEAIDINGEPLISQIAYEPDGQIGSWNWSNGEYSERFYDLAGRPIAISLGFDGQNLWPALRNYSYDAASRITGISDDSDPELDQVFGYDGLDRLISSQKGAVTLSTSDYTYDLSGNRTSKILNNSLTETHSIDPGSNRLLQKSGVQTINYSYDPAGHLLTDGTLSYSYNAQGRRIGATAVNLNATYSYNALGQRISKTVNGTTTRFVYDQQGHLLGEYNATGQLIQEIVWLGDLPIAVLKPNAAQSTFIDVFYIHSDHLATPRKITRPSDNKSVWTWESEAFGNSLPNQNPSNLGSFIFNLRFPGQYYDPETGLHYNVFRDYDPDGGRYIESDPIGLAGGINTYSYVGGNPINYTDPKGLNPVAAAIGLCRLFPAQCVAAAAATAAAAKSCVDGVTKMLNEANNDQLSDDALVCRGGTCTSDRFKEGSGVTIDENGNLQGVSVNSANGKSADELTNGIPNRQVGVTTVGDVRDAGGNVVPSPTAGNPDHATLNGITPQQAQDIFTPTIPNPNARR